MAQMSVAEYARHRKLTDRAVVVALKAGRIHRNEEGWIDSEQADRDWAANTNPEIAERAKKGGIASAKMRRLRAGKPQAVPDKSKGKPIPIDEGVDTFTRARADKEHFAALLTKVKYEESSGQLVNRAEWEQAANSWARMIRDAFLAIPDRLSAQLAVECDARAVHLMLDTELRDVLERMSRMKTVPAPRRRRGQHASYG